MPQDRLQRAQVLQWMFFEQYSHEPNIATLRFWTHLPELDDAQKAQVAGKRVNGDAALKLMDEHLTENDWFVGSKPTIANIALLPTPTLPRMEALPCQLTLLFRRGYQGSKACPASYP